MKPLRVTSVGAGYFAQFHFAAWQRLASEGLVKHVGLAEPDVVRRNAALQSFNIPLGCGSLANMLASVDIDVLDIATPPDTHALLVQLAVDRGITCICQKPLAPTCEEAIAIVAGRALSMTMYVITVVFKIRPGQLEQFLPLLKSNAARSREDEPGCHEFHVCIDPQQPDDIFLYEIYGSKADFEAHLKTPHFLEFSEQTAGMIQHREVRALELIAR